ncbi:MAG TPA: hypothetical protein VFK44_09615 [Bacillales bacterium]|nr:hypothetical protein [Bacillales bacterium]
MRTVYYNSEEGSFFSLKGKGFLWGADNQQVHLLQSWTSNVVIAVPDLAFHQHFFRMDSNYLDKHLFRLGWSEFGVKKFLKDHDKYLRDS